MVAKMTRDLESRLASSEADEVVEVLIELSRDESATNNVASDGSSRTEVINSLKSIFEVMSSKVEHEIQSSGGTVIDRAWINQTVRARLPAKVVARLADRDDIAVIDVPHKIEPEIA